MGGGGAAPPVSPPSPLRLEHVYILMGKREWERLTLKDGVGINLCLASEEVGGGRQQIRSSDQL